MILFFLNIHIYIYVFKYISYLTLGISQAGAAHLAQVQSRMARWSPTRGSPHPLTHTCGEKPPRTPWAPTRRGASWQKDLGDRRAPFPRCGAPTPVPCLIPARKNRAGSRGSRWPCLSREGGPGHLPRSLQPQPFCGSESLGLLPMPSSSSPFQQDRVSWQEVPSASLSSV